METREPPRRSGRDRGALAATPRARLRRRCDGVAVRWRSSRGSRRTAPLAEPGDEGGEGGSLVVAEVAAPPTGSSTTTGMPRDTHVRGEVVEPRRLDAAFSASSEASASSPARSASATEMRSAAMTPARNGSTSRPSTDTGSAAPTARCRRGVRCRGAARHGSPRAARQGLVDDRIRVARRCGRHPSTAAEFTATSALIGAAMAADVDEPTIRIDSTAADNSPASRSETQLQTRERQDQHADDDRAESS